MDRQVMGMRASCVSDGQLHDLDEAAMGTGVAPVFQPIVSLPECLPVGYEALARWPQHPHLGPQSVFAHATATDRVSRLDRLCIDRAVDGALRGGLTEGALLCINSEPASEYTGPAQSEILQRGHHRFELLFEITERDLLANLPTLLRKVNALRADGIAIALDDVGAHPDSLALLDVVCPEFIKLAMNLVQAPPHSDSARTEAAIMAHRERTGTVIIAEGIENDQHLEQALALGASLGQGFLFGRPGPLPIAPSTVPWQPPAAMTSAGTAFGSPFDAVDAASVRTARTDTLVAMSRHLEERALGGADAPMVLTALQHSRHFTAPIRARYAALAGTCPLVAVLAQDLPAALPLNVRGVSLDASDRLSAQWAVVTLGPHTAAALIAREHGDPSGVPDEQRRFDFVLTHDRRVVTAAAYALMSRLS